MISALLWKSWGSGRSCQLWLIWGPSVGLSSELVLQEASQLGCRAGQHCRPGLAQLTADHTLHQRHLARVSPALWKLLQWMQSAPAASRGWGHAACHMRSLHLCFSLPCHSVLCSGSCLWWFDDPLHLWSAKTVTSAENIYMYDKTESCSFCEALSLWKNIVSIKPNSLLRHSSSSSSVNVIFQQKINKDSLACSYFFCNPHPTNTATTWGPDSFLCTGPCKATQCLESFQVWSFPGHLLQPNRCTLLNSCQHPCVCIKHSEN